jgi:hypothetical protein
VLIDTSKHRRCSQASSLLAPRAPGSLFPAWERIARHMASAAWQTGIEAARRSQASIGLQGSRASGTLAARHQGTGSQRR